jgi:hypothetical protein
MEVPSRSTLTTSLNDAGPELVATNSMVTVSPGATVVGEIDSPDRPRTPAVEGVGVAVAAGAGAKPPPPEEGTGVGVGVGGIEVTFRFTALTVAAQKGKLLTSAPTVGLVTPEQPVKLPIETTVMVAATPLTVNEMASPAPPPSFVSRVATSSPNTENCEAGDWPYTPPDAVAVSPDAKLVPPTVDATVSPEVGVPATLTVP